MSRRFFLIGCLIPFLLPPGAEAGRKPKVPELRSIDRIIRDSEAQAREVVLAPGSLYDPAGRLADLSRDQRALQPNDLVTIVIFDKASAVSKGASTASRKSSVSASVKALAGPVRTPGPLSSLADLSGEGKLDGQAETSRESQLSTTLSARVTHALPNGNLVVEGTKEITINSERQRVYVRGILRWNDLSTSNRISSDRLAELEVKVDGKGLVNDSIRRPGLLYRLLLGILPF
ncbi:MAG: flagellar basal body L-ring protein FlgH [Bryobacterales bacterium]|nr:flagellar basal body L-ring protein FlgH [Bryobacterales bacterium]